MKPITAIIVSGVCLTLGACSVHISDDGIARDYDDYKKDDRLTITLPNGERDSISCPRGTSAFVINKSDEGKGIIYGCRTDGTRMPTLDGGSGE